MASRNIVVVLDVAKMLVAGRSRVLDLSVRGLMKFRQRGNSIESNKSGVIDGRYIDGDDENNLFYPFAWQEALIDDMRRHGMKEPIEFSSDGGRPHIVEGHHRLTAASDIGWNKIRTLVHPSITNEMLDRMNLK